MILNSRHRMTPESRPDLSLKLETGSGKKKFTGSSCRNGSLFARDRDDLLVGGRQAGFVLLRSLKRRSSGRKVPAGRFSFQTLEGCTAGMSTSIRRIGSSPPDVMVSTFLRRFEPDGQEGVHP